MGSLITQMADFAVGACNARAQISQDGRSVRLTWQEVLEEGARGSVVVWEADVHASELAFIEAQAATPQARFHCFKQVLWACRKDVSNATTYGGPPQ